MSHADVERLRAIKTFPALVKYLRDELEWPIESEDVEDLTFEYDPEELGIDLKTSAKIQEIKQLRPVSKNQPWGIFFLKFEPKRLPVTVLRRVLSRLVVKKRQTAAQSKQAVWHLHDLLFISSYGEGDDRQITFAHFTQDEAKGDLPTLKVLGWDDQDTRLHMDHAVRSLKTHFRWPANEANKDAWRDAWSAPFAYRHREAISTAKDLAAQLAGLAMRIRSRVNQAMDVETAKGPIRKLYKAFQEALIHDLTEPEFADMYAQTITYGLLAARVSRPLGIVADNLSDLIPVTNPFLKEMLETFLKVGGRSKGGLDFDELGVQEVVEVLNDKDTHIEAVLREFNNRDRQEDPVIHFYEDFLSAYDNAQKKKRGVFYTPQPVVSYIVRTVNERLKSEFGLAEGLASTITWGEIVETHSELKVPLGTRLDSPFVQILDPATGTGTFLVEVIELIYQTLRTKWKGEGLTEKQQIEAWNEYVPKHLLPRIHGYELMMAPYAIAHLKIGLKLYESGYRFHSDERARIYLTNALEPPNNLSQARLEGILPALAHEAHAVSEIKRSQRFTVVIGNPPYSASISEPEWLMQKLDDWKQGLNETKMDLNREEWKFFRLAQELCNASGAGIVGFIINRDFLDGIVKRRMREHLGMSFRLRTIVDLNGDVKGNIPDQNVFEIEQGVAIVVLSTHHEDQKLQYVSRVGTQQQKYVDLASKQPIDNDLSEVEITSPYFRWVPFLSEFSAADEGTYSKWPQIKSGFTVASSGIQTKRDALCISFTKEEMWEQVQRFHSLPTEKARSEFDLGPDGRDWTVALAKADLSGSGPNKKYLCPILYRPFDIRYTYWTGKTKGFMSYPRREVMQHIVGQKNVGLIFNRQIVGDGVSHFGVSRIPICHGTFYLGNKGQDYFAPLLIFEEDLVSGGMQGRSNLDPLFVAQIRQALIGDLDMTSPERIMNYSYAIFHSPTYRKKYSEFLKIDFPRLPITGNPDLFKKLSNFGQDLVALHLLESPKLDTPITTFSGPKNPEVERVCWVNETVWLDSAAVSKGQVPSAGENGFNGISEKVWNFEVGGYQICEKWLKDRKGRILTKDDIAHYQKMIVAIFETIRIMNEIDKVIEAHGGWPGAFATGTP